MHFWRGDGKRLFYDEHFFSTISWSSGQDRQTKFCEIRDQHGFPHDLFCYHPLVINQKKHFEIDFIIFQKHTRETALFVNISVILYLGGVFKLCMRL